MTAVVAPPNNWDSLVSHMSRVMHWIQNRSVEFYATHVLWQLVHPPGAEYIVMHLQLLADGDRFANRAQWFSMAGSLIGASLLARELGANRRGQVFAAVVCATIPMGLLQAPTTKNDYVVSLWLVCLAYFTLRLTNHDSLAGTLSTAIEILQDRARAAVAPGRRIEASDRPAVQLRANSVGGHPAEPLWLHLGAGSALGLALLTKATAYVFGLPFLAWYGLSVVTARRAPALKSLALIGVIALCLNANHYRRNIALFGLPLGPTTLGVGDQYKYTNDLFGSRVTALNAVKNLALHMGTPFTAANRALEYRIAAFASALGFDLNDPAITYELGRIPFEIRPPNTFEDQAGNPLHLILVLATFGWFIFFWRPTKDAPPRPAGSISPQTGGEIHQFGAVYAIVPAER